MSCADQCRAGEAHSSGWGPDRIPAQVWGDPCEEVMVNKNLLKVKNDALSPKCVTPTTDCSVISMGEVCAGRRGRCVPGRGGCVCWAVGGVCAGWWGGVCWAVGEVCAGQWGRCVLCGGGGVCCAVGEVCAGRWGRCVLCGGGGVCCAVGEVCAVRWGRCVLCGGGGVCWAVGEVCAGRWGRCVLCGGGGVCCAVGEVLTVMCGGRLGLRVPASGGYAVQCVFFGPCVWFCAPSPALKPPPSPRR